jgi:hypothetical protein
MRPMKMSSTWILGVSLAFAVAFMGPPVARAAEPAAPAKAADGAGAKAKGKEVTLKGDLGCGKCSFKVSKACENVLKVKEGGKDVMYHLAHNDVSEAKHEDICSSGLKPATVKGTVAQDGKKKILTASEIKID